MPFQLAHGGGQLQIEQTMAAVARLGIDVEPLRWHDPQQRGDLIHFFGMPHGQYIEKAAAAGVPLLATVLLTANCNHSDLRQSISGRVRKLASALPGSSAIRNQTNWDAYLTLPQFVVGLKCEAEVLTRVYGVNPGKIARVPLGLPDEFLSCGEASRSGDFLITPGTITERKRSVELAEMARTAGVPLLFVGKPYGEEDPYWKRFSQLIDGQTIRHQPHVADRRELITLLQSARGFVLYSEYENWCLSAHEAAACGLPLLVQDQKWSRECFGDQARYLAHRDRGNENPARLKKFFEECPKLGKPNLPHVSWDDVAERVVAVYKSCVSQK